MKLEQLRRYFSGPLAILESELDTLMAEVAVATDDVTAEEVAAQVKARYGGGRSGSQDGGIAVVPVHGPLDHRASWWTSYEALTTRLTELDDDPTIGLLILDFDTPGGVVTGCAEAAECIRGLKTRTIGIANGRAASAGYWLAAACDQVVVLGSGDIGSVGTVLLHVEMTKALEDAGFKVTIIRDAAHKYEGSPFEPLSDEARAHFEERVASFGTDFVSAVARYRNVSTEHVRKHFGQGRTLRATDAVRVGMADRIASLEDILEECGVPTSARAGSSARAQAAAPEAASDDPAPGDESSGPRGQEGRTVKKNDTAAPGGAEDQGDESATTTATVTRDAEAAGRERASEIAALCAMHGAAELAADFIADGKTIGQVGAALRARAENGQKPTRPSSVTEQISDRERRPYSIARAIASTDPDFKGDAGYEREVSQELSRIHGRQPQGIHVATHMGLPTPSAAGLDSGTANAGAELVFTEPGSFIDLLRTRAMVMALGADFMPGLVGDVSMPKQTAAMTAAWRAENPGSDAADSNLTTDTVTLSPKTLIGSTSFSRQLLRQNRYDVEMRVRRDIAAVHARAVDLAAIQGGGSNEPSGILDTAGIGDVALGANGAAPTFTDIIDLETEITADDADIGTMAYLTTAAMRGVLKKTEEFSGSNGRPVWRGSVQEGEMNGYRAAASNQVPSTLTKGSNSDCHAIIFGVWASLIIGEWGVLDVITDPYRLKKQGMIEVTSFQMVDLVLRYAEAFAAIQDARIA